MGIFGNKKKEERSVSKSDASQITTLIGESCVFEGNVTTTSSTRIDGQLKGKITGEYSLIVGENGIVQGEIKAAETIVYGRVEGIIESGKLEIKSSGAVVGDVFIEKFTVDDGASFNGRCEMTDSQENVMFESNSPDTKELPSSTIDVDETS
jgi:cytoskeletal protein CcmA (bactofilin family)